MPNTIDNSEDLLDSRDIIARIAELESERDEECHDCEGTGEHLDGAGTVCPTCDGAKVVGLAEDDADELAALLAFQSEAEGYAPDWRYGATLIRDSHFETYAQELAEDIYGREVNAAKWPFSCIDWERAARELQGDYTSVEFAGVTYWVQ